MGWQLVNKPMTQKVTRKLAKEFAEMDPAPHDRPLSERRLQVYHRLVNEKQFRPVTWAKAFCVETNGTYRVNGKHTSTLLSGLDPLPEFFVTVEEYTCDTLEDVARLYATFDSTMQSRSAFDIYHSFAATVPEMKEVWGQCLRIAVVGMAQALDLSKSTAPERAELILEHADFVLWCNSILRGTEKGSGRFLFRGPVAAAMFQSYRKSKAAATEFWTAVRDETDPARDAPSRKLARYLATSGTVVKSEEHRKSIRKSSPREMFVKCLHAWNAWRKGETTNMNYHPEAPVPVVK